MVFSYRKAALPMKTLRIETDTAKYYLNLEHAFLRLCQQTGIDLDAYLQDFQSIMPTGFDVTKRYEYRCDLHDAWAEVVTKKEYKPKNKGRTIF